MTLFRTLRHLLPRGKAWSLTVDKNLRAFFSGLSEALGPARDFVDLVWLDIFPKTTREVSAWEEQFGLPGVDLSESQRRDRLSAAWGALGGQDPRYIQDTLRANGFDVYVYEWWEPGSEPAIGSTACATPRNPLLRLRREYTDVRLLVECGEALAACGEEFAQSGNSLQPSGFPLVNKITFTERDIIPVCGEALAACGEPSALAGNYATFRERRAPYTVPADSDKWPYFLYIGGLPFGELATVTPARQDEFEALCLKICPAHLWLGMLVEYS
jgi:hypothetical protein